MEDHLQEALEACPTREASILRLEMYPIRSSYPCQVSDYGGLPPYVFVLRRRGGDSATYTGDCTRATETWDKFGPNTYGRDIGIPGGRSRPNLITLIKEAKLKCPISSARICLYVTICHEIWKARNTFIFDQKVTRVPRALCFWKVASFLRATSTEGDTATRAAQLRARALQVVCVVIREVWPRWLGDWDPG